MQKGSWPLASSLPAVEKVYGPANVCVAKNDRSSPADVCIVRQQLSAR
jgi:hypothetical protein